MEAEKFFSFYDSYWFELQILNKQRFPSNNRKYSSISEAQNPTKSSTETESSQIQIQNHHHNRSMSDQLNSATCLASGFSSTDSSPQKLYTILSEKEIPYLETSTPEKQRLHKTEPPKKTKREKRMRRKRSETKSFSDLEFEEVKGFMDLGFVFSEEDRESSLAEIIPGLHRLGEKREEEKGWDFDCDEKEETLISRPYLSEAWEFLNLKPKREYQNPLINLRFPALSNEIDMKDHLKWWAHTVASTVR